MINLANLKLKEVFIHHAGRYHFGDAIGISLIAGEIVDDFWRHFSEPLILDFFLDRMMSVGQDF